MKILVLGSKSFMGRTFCRYAQATGHHVFGWNRPEWNLNDETQFPVEAALQDGFAHVVNYAALNMVAESWTYAADYYRTNVVGIARLGECLLRNRSRLARFVQFSTPEVYGTTESFIKEGAVFNPSTPYAISRAAGDWHLSVLNRVHDLPVCFTRTVNVYGEGQQLYRIIPKTALACIRGETLRLDGGGVSTRSFIHAMDVAAATMRVLTDGRPGETYHIAHPKQVRIRDLVRTVCEKMGKRLEDVAVDAPDRPGKDMNYQLDDSKIRHELGWCQTIDLAEGLDGVIRWIQTDHRELKGERYVHVA